MNNRIDDLIDQADEYAINLVDDNDLEDYPLLYSRKFAELLIQEYSRDLMNIHAASPEQVQLAAKSWGVEV